MVGEGCFSFTVVPNRGRGLINPVFYIFMTDRETIELVYATLKTRKLPGYFETRRAKGNNREQYGIRVNGVKSMKRLCDALVPYLTGEKEQAARLALGFCDHRLALPYGAPYGPKDIEFIAKSRTINGQRTHHKTPLEQLPSILRDYTPYPSV